MRRGSQFVSTARSHNSRVFPITGKRLCPAVRPIASPTKPTGATGALYPLRARNHLVWDAKTRLAAAGENFPVCVWPYVDQLLITIGSKAALDSRDEKDLSIRIKLTNQDIALLRDIRGEPALSYFLVKFFFDFGETLFGNGF